MEVICTTTLPLPSHWRHGSPSPTYMYKQAFTSMKYGYGSSVAIMIVVICMVVGLVFRKITGEGAEE